MLYLAPGTARKHLDNVYAKLDVGSRAGAVARAFLNRGSTAVQAGPNSWRLLSSRGVTDTGRHNG